MVEIHVVEVTDAPVEIAFDYVANYENFPKFMYGMSALKPTTPDNTRGLGATFEGGMQLGPVHLKSTVETIEYEENKVLAVDSIKGFDVDMKFKFTPVDEHHAEVDAYVTYRLPGGIAGKALGKTIEPFVKIAVKYSTHELKKQIAEQYEQRKAG
ncbi:SRPBCC family protein [Skermania sp. ID1734]|uniref:SRPBCC family protein n=1 Tax=Skermania sp. ID1734 TaxID=2597516 RepID=UPI00117FE9A6|nr:SRPBCC family protein [Skermania sp. ID1734]TSD93457.1 SRPBCC family protein [Skermania sp. ID1734]